MRDRIIPIAMLASAAALLAAACGGDDEPSPVLDVPTPPATEEQQTTPPAAQQQEEEQPAPEAEQAEADPNRELLSYGESLRTAITDVDPTRQFRFTGEAGDVVRISVNGHGGMDPLITLQEPSRIDIATDDDSGPGRDALLVARLPYRRTASRTGLGVRERHWRVHNQHRSAAGGSGRRRCHRPDRRCHPGPAGYPGDVDIFEFDGDTGQPMVIRADGILGTDTRAQIFGPDLNFLLEDDDSGHGLDAELRLVLPDTGRYRLEVFAVGNRIGPYELRINTDVPATEPSEPLRETLEGLAITYLSALQEESSPILLTLAGPELFQDWGLGERGGCRFGLRPSIPA